MSLEYDNNENTWRSPSSIRSIINIKDMACSRIPNLSTTVTVVVLGIAILSCFAGYYAFSNKPQYLGSTLKHVNILFRHGARTPTSLYPTDPHLNYTWANGLGSLTIAGKQQIYKLGQTLRFYYNNFLPDAFMDKHVRVDSSDSSRTLMSAQLLLAGLYPPTAEQMWNDALPWQPIPVHTLPRLQDKMIAARKPCKKHDQLKKKYFAEIIDQYKYSELFEYLSEHTNSTIKDMIPAELLFGTLFIEQELGLKLPDWTVDIYDKMDELMKQTFAALTYDEEMKRLKAGPLLEDILKDMSTMIRGKKSERLIHLYSGHDVTLVNLWRSLGMEELIRPNYGASLVLELHQIDGEYIVKTFYWPDTKVNKPIELKIPICTSDPCLYADFKNATSKLIPLNWNEECENVL